MTTKSPPRMNLERAFAVSCDFKSAQIEFQLLLNGKWDNQQLLQGYLSTGEMLDLECKRRERLEDGAAGVERRGRREEGPCSSRPSASDGGGRTRAGVPTRPEPTRGSLSGEPLGRWLKCTTTKLHRRKITTFTRERSSPEGKTVFATACTRFLSVWKFRCPVIHYGELVLADELTKKE